MLLNITQAYIDLYAALIAISIFFALIVKKTYFSYAGKQFTILSFIIFLLCFFEGITFLYAEHSNAVILFLEETLTFLLFLLTPLMVGYLAKFIYFIVKKRRIPMVIQTLFFTPFCIVLILLIVNLFLPFIYDFSGNGVYLRLGGYVYIALLSSIGVLFVILFLIVNRKELSSWVFVALIISYSLPFFGAFIQIDNPDWATIYPFSSFALLIAFIFMESIGVTKDFLTNVFTRKKVFEILQTYLLNNFEFVLGLFDVDELKKLNDSYGHLVGDAALLHLVSEMNRAFNRNAVIARIGGDEFVLICRSSDLKEVRKQISSINNQFIHNKNKYKCEFSYGLVKIDKTTDVRIDDLIHQVDKEMYKMKRMKQADVS